MLEIELIQVALGVRDVLSHVPSQKEWDAIFAFAERHGIMGVLFGGVERLPKPQLPNMDLLMDWLGQAEYQKTQYEEQRKAVDSLVALWESAGLHVVELKGNSIGQYYPRPELRYSCDFDSFLLKESKEGKESKENVKESNLLKPGACPEQSRRETLEPLETFGPGYEDGNEIAEAQGVTVNREFYKNSSFMWKGLHVENHQFCCPVRGNKRMKRFERTLRNLLFEHLRTKVGELVEPQNHSVPSIPSVPAQFNALFLMEHMWAHFFEEALTMKQMLDWVVFRKECSKDVDWQAFESAARDCGFWEFAVAINRIADAILGMESKEGIESKEGVLSLPFEPWFLSSSKDSTFSTPEARLWQSILQGGGSIEMNNGWSTRFQLIGNYFRNSWKYRYFAPHGALYTLARTSLAYIFDKKPKL